MDQFTINLLFVGASPSRSTSASRSGPARAPHLKFYAAGRGVHPVTNGMATAADWIVGGVFHFDGGPHRLHRL